MNGAAGEERRLLILSCSRRKTAIPDLIPAIQRYDGPAFRILRRFLREQAPARVDTWVLSANFGLISAYQPIPYYDRRMTPDRARELHPSVMAKLGEILGSAPYAGLLIAAGRDYLIAMEGYAEVLTPYNGVSVANGQPGRRLAILHDWLYRQPPKHHQFARVVGGQGRASIRGVNVVATPEQVLELARRGLDAGQQAATRGPSWHVAVGERQVSPKWLVSQLAGLPVSDFSTDQARRLLSQLGVKVMRT